MFSRLVRIASRRPIEGVIGLVAGCLLLLASTAAARAESWTEVDSPNFRVFTDGSVGSARQVADSFERMRWIFSRLIPGIRLDSGAPLLIFAARDSGTEKYLEPGFWKATRGNAVGNFLHGWEKQYVMVRTDSDTGLEVPSLVFHEYTHSIVHMNAHWLPMWLDEGMAEYYGNSRFDGNKVYIGAPTSRVRSLRSAHIPIEKLIEITPSSGFWKDDISADEFYAESWALVHYLIWLDGGVKLNQFYHLIQTDVSQKKAFEQVFGNFADADRNLQKTMAYFEYKVGVLNYTGKIEDKAFKVTKLDKAEGEAQVAGFHIWDHDLKDAWPLVEKALAGDANLGLAHEEKGFLLFADGDDSAAQKEFARAYALDKSLYLAHFYEIMLSPQAASDAPADQEALQKGLTEVTDSNTQFAPAYVQLALLAVRRKQYKTARSFSLRAEELEPSRAGYHVLTGQIDLRLENYAEAAAYAKFVADHWMFSDHDEAAELWNQIPAAKRPPGISLTDQPVPGTTSASGIITSMTCGAKDHPWSVTLESATGKRTFQSKGAMMMGVTDTLWYGEDHFSDCHHIEGMPAVIRYLPGKSSTEAGQVMEFEIRDRLSAIEERVSPLTVADTKAEK